MGRGDGKPKSALGEERLAIVGPNESSTRSDSACHSIRSIGPVSVAASHDVCRPQVLPMRVVNRLSWILASTLALTGFGYIAWPGEAKWEVFLLLVAPLVVRVALRRGDRDVVDYTPPSTGP